jgi:hypothetical protein
MYVVPGLLAIDKNWVYYATGLGSPNLWFRGVHDPPNGTSAQLGPIDNATSLAAADGYVAWATSTGVDGGTGAAVYFQKAQAAPPAMPLFMGPGLITSLIGHGQSFYFASGQANLVTAIPLVSQHVVAEAMVVDAIAADLSHLYVALAGAIVAGDPFGMSVQTLTSDPGARFLATTDTDANLYWIIPNGGTPSIRMAPKAGGPAVTIGNPAMSTPMSLAVDKDAVYVASWAGSCPGQMMMNGQIQRVDLATHKETLLPDVVCPFVIVADDVCIYWTDPNSATGGLMRLAK